jgi:hypothetical protein
MFKDMGRWREANDTRTLWTHDWLFDAMEKRLDWAEAPRLVASPTRFEGRPGDVWKQPLSMLVTSRRVLLARKKVLGKRSDVRTWWCHAISRYDTGQSRSGSGWEVRFDHESNGWIVFVFRTPQEADCVAKLIAYGA